MRFGLQHPSFSFDYEDDDTSQIFGSLKTLVTSAEEKGFDSFWVMDHFHRCVGFHFRPAFQAIGIGDSQHRSYQNRLDKRRQELRKGFVRGKASQLFASPRRVCVAAATGSVNC